MQTILATQSTASTNMPQLFQVKNAMAEQQYKEKLAEVIVVVYIVRCLKQQSSNAMCSSVMKTTSDTVRVEHLLCKCYSTIATYNKPGSRMV